MNKRYIGYIETARLFEDGYAWKFEVKIKTRYKDFFAYFTVEQFPDFARVLQISEGKEIRQQTVRIEVNENNQVVKILHFLSDEYFECLE